MTLQLADTKQPIVNRFPAAVGRLETYAAALP